MIHMNAKGAFWTVLLSVAGCAILGGMGSLIIDALLPNYYASVLHLPEASRISPSLAGMQLGITQGIGLGILFSLGALAFATFRMNSVPDQAHQTQTERKPGFWRGKAPWCCVTLILVILFSSITFVTGGIIAQEQLYQSLRNQKLEKLATLLETGMYPQLKSDFSSAAQVYLVGSVNSDQQYQNLKQQLISSFGTSEAENMIWLVDVK